MEKEKFERQEYESTVPHPPAPNNLHAAWNFVSLLTNLWVYHILL